MGMTFVIESYCGNSLVDVSFLLEKLFYVYELNIRVESRKPNCNCYNMINLLADQG